MAVAACSSSSSSSSPASTGSTSSASSTGSANVASSTTLPSTITVTSIQDLTGAVGPVGISTQDGMNLAVKAINSSHMLGNTQIQITYKDTQTTQSQAVAEASAAASTNVDAIFGPVLSTEAVAVAPIVESAKIPTIFTQAGGPGVVTPGGYVFRVTAPQSDYQPNLVKYLAAHNVKTVTMLYDSTVPTTAGIASPPHGQVRLLIFPRIDIPPLDGITVTARSGRKLRAGRRPGLRSNARGPAAPPDPRAVMA